MGTVFLMRFIVGVISYVEVSIETSNIKMQNLFECVQKDCPIEMYALQLCDGVVQFNSQNVYILVIALWCGI